MFEQLVSYINWAAEFVLHMDVHLNALVAMAGPWIYLILFLIIFCETGIVVTPFLPGDSLLFALGALAAVENAVLSLPLLFCVLFVAAVLGDATNYYFGQRIGPRVFSSDTSRFLNRQHLLRTQEFYEKHGGKTIVLARFVPIIRTFAPFVAGIGKMSYARFAMFNVTGAFAWVVSFLVLGNLFGNLPSIKQNFHFVIFGIIGISVLPVVVEWWKSRYGRNPA
jgi:membrane-associated protein